MKDCQIHLSVSKDSNNRIIACFKRMMVFSCCINLNALNNFLRKNYNRKVHSTAAQRSSKLIREYSEAPARSYSSHIPELGKLSLR